MATPLFTWIGGQRFYWLWALGITLLAMLLFLGSTRQQIELLYAALPPSQLTERLRSFGPWSAPLDDVFIHFDFARSAARGHPFEWVEGNGYSSGGTSLLYPFVLALGWLIGFRELTLMVWATGVAVFSVFGFCVATRRMFRALPAPTALLVPPTLLCVGVLNWNLWSGMEVAFFLGLWSAAFVLWDRLISFEGNPKRLFKKSLWLGLVGASLAATRPEGITSVGVLAVGAAIAVAHRDSLRRSAWVLAVCLVPSLLVLAAQSGTNLLLTGESNAAGAISKLEMHDPFRSATQIFEDWKFFIHYQVDRVTEYHLSDDPKQGWTLWYLAALPLFSERTRKYALLLWASILPWTMVVALNGQVRWQNERYAMPALAWLLVLAALGVASLWGEGWKKNPVGILRGAVGVGLGLWICQGFLVHERARFADQLWFYGRASRNILEQHVRTGIALRYELDPPPQRIALGDAGAIPYAADLPALDLIGLGGYRGLPFARAKRLGLGAVIELVERIPPEDRPDVMALYPSWWDDLPVWFGSRMFEVPVHGNVICGAASKVVYRADWSSLEDSGRPFGIPETARIVDQIDVGDLVSEKAHSYRISEPLLGYATMRLLPHPRDATRDLWDGGRVVPGGVRESLLIKNLSPGRPIRLVFRTAPETTGRLRVHFGKEEVQLDLPPAQSGWSHSSVTVPGAWITDTILPIEIESPIPERTSYHIWITQELPPPILPLTVQE